MRQFNYKCVVAKNDTKMYYKRVHNKWKRISNKVGMKAEKGKKKYKTNGKNNNNNNNNKKESEEEEHNRYLARLGLTKDELAHAKKHPGWLPRDKLLKYLEKENRLVRKDQIINQEYEKKLREDQEKREERERRMGTGRRWGDARDTAMAMLRRNRNRN